MKYLTLQDTYLTPEREISVFAKISPSAVFYPKMLLTVVKAARLAKRGSYTDRHWIKSSLEILDALESVGVVLEFENLSVIRKLETPCVFVGNHMSVLETFVLPCLIHPYRPVTFVVKDDLISYPLFRHVMKSRNPVVVRRLNPREDMKNVLKQGAQRLKNNVSIVIFPQTTRYVDFDPKRFNTLGVKLAKYCKVPAVAMALKTDAWGMGKKFKDFGKVYPEKKVWISFSDPITIEGNGKREHHGILKFISEKMQEWSDGDEAGI